MHACSMMESGEAGIQKLKKYRKNLHLQPLDILMSHDSMKISSKTAVSSVKFTSFHAGLSLIGAFSGLSTSQVNLIRNYLAVSAFVAQ